MSMRYHVSRVQISSKTVVKWVCTITYINNNFFQHFLKEKIKTRKVVIKQKMWLREYIYI